MLMLLGNMHADLGLEEKSAQLYRKAVDLATSVYGEDALEAFDPRMKLADALHSSNSDANVESVLKDAQRALERSGDNDDYRRARLADQFAQYYATRDVPAALVLARLAVERYEHADAPDDLAQALSRLARIQHNGGQDGDAVASYQRTIELSRAANGDNNPDLPRYYAELAEIQVLHHNIANGERNARNALQAAKAIHGENHVDVVQCEMRLGRLLADTGRMQEGSQLLASAKHKVMALLGPDDGFHTPQVLFQNGVVEIRAGKTEEGLADVQAAIDNRRRNRPGTMSLAYFLGVAAAAETEMGRIADADRDLKETRAILEKTGQKAPSSSFDAFVNPYVRWLLATERTDDALQSLGQLNVDAADRDGLDSDDIANELMRAEVASAVHREQEAIERARRVRENIQASTLAPYYQGYVSRANFIEGFARLRSGDSGGAIAPLENTLRERERDLDVNSVRIAEAQMALAEAYLAQHRDAEAQSLAGAAARILAGHVELRASYRQSLQQLLKRVSHPSRAVS